MTRPGSLVARADATWPDGRPATRSVACVPPTDPETPYMVIYTSGTTGAPKGTVHVHGGFPIKAAQDLAHTFDLRAGDTLFWFTDLGWMMGPWAIIGAPLIGARLVIYEGAPDYPGPDRIWSIVDRHRVTHLGVSPTLVRALTVHGEEPVRAHDRSLAARPRFDRRAVEPGSVALVFPRRRRRPPADRQLLAAAPRSPAASSAASLLRPIRPTSFNGPASGWASTSSSRRAPLRGESASSRSGRPWPGMTRGFWGEPERRALSRDVLAADARPLDPRRLGRDDDDGYWYLLGRSDDTLKVAGKRVGPAEVEAGAVAHPSSSRRPRSAIPTAQGRGDRRPRVPRPGARAEAVAREICDLVVTISARRSGPRPSSPSRTCPGPAAARSCAGSPGRPISGGPGDLSALENPAAVDLIAAAGRSA